MIWKKLFRSGKHQSTNGVKEGAEYSGIFPLRSVDVQLNTFCNADCFFCVAHDKSPTPCIDFEAFQGLARHVHMETVEEIVLTGGEPTVNKDLNRILRFAYQRYPHMVVRLITNAIYLPPDLMDSLLLGNVASLHVSINASNAADYARITGVDRFERVIKNIRTIVERRKELKSSSPTICASLVLVKENMSNVIPFIHMGCELGLDSVYILNAGLTPELANSSASEDPEALHEIFQQAQNVASKNGITIGLPIAPAGGTETNRCIEPWRKVFVAAGGEVNPCCGYDFGVSRDQQLRGNLLSQNLEEFWYGGLYDSLRRGLKTSNPLPGCKACYRQMFTEV